MTLAAAPAGGPATPDALPSRGVRLFRVAVLLVAGLAIAFSATMHERLGFDLALASVALGAIGVAHLVHVLRGRAAGGVAIPALLGAVALVAALVVPFTGTAIGFAVAIAAWALVSALLEFIGAAVRPGSRQDATLLGAIGILLAICALLVRDDPVAILGFFGGYAIVAGVFLGISAFDRRGGAPEAAAGAR
ncbi:hypothetical protein MUN78_15710 [Leucobacter allii]|uniref:DUF308 domain-containing protein n=1 Tax=Leucobacter allii TaxID=2932247 RepID=A0ABY4FLD1_9MICO|nr:hypothetical protein [Leucobacter allii]UOQ57082.1 hypothetical protein MUN78_15710 [Leucobacter allii]